VPAEKTSETAAEPKAPSLGTQATNPKAPRVLVVGGGIAGLTTALRLAERGYRVTLLEKKEMLGGNLASRTFKNGECLDVYPHMYQAWYRNFWALMEDVHDEPEAPGNEAGKGASGAGSSAGGEDPKAGEGDQGGQAGTERSNPVWKQECFRPFSKVWQAQPMEKDRKAKLAGLTRPYSAAHLLENLFSGVAPPADMFLFGYASLDLMAEKRNPTLKLENVSLTGYLSSRVYMTQTALEAYEAFVLRVWGIPAYMISAADCQAYAAYCYAAADEDGYLSTGASEENVIDPIVKKLETFTMPGGEHAVKIETGCEVTGITLEETAKKGRYRVKQVEWRKAEDDDGTAPVKLASRSIAKRSDYVAEEPTTIDFAFSAEAPKVPIKVDGFKVETGSKFDSVVLAVPPNVLSTLARRRPLNVGGTRIVDAIPALAELRRVGSAPIPVLHLYLKTKLKIPSDPVALNRSELSLAFTDISENWKKTFRGVGTVLALSCSEPIPLTGPLPEDDAFAMVKELAKYLPFDPGTKWGSGGDVNWSKTKETYETNADSQLSLNSVGSDRWRPETCYPDQVANLYFAGDYCKHDYGITTIEGAVATGIKAAAAVRRRSRGLGAEIKPVAVELLPSEVFVGMRYAWLTSALAAMGWSRLTTPSEVARRASEEGPAPGGDPFEALAKSSTLRYLLTPGLPAQAEPHKSAKP
jgi:hypothetical protein